MMSLQTARVTENLGMDDTLLFKKGDTVKGIVTYNGNLVSSGLTIYRGFFELVQTSAAKR